MSFSALIIELAKFIFSSAFVSFAIFATMRIQCKSNNGRFLCESHEATPRFGWIGLIVMLITTPAAGLWSLLIVTELFYSK